MIYLHNIIIHLGRCLRDSIAVNRPSARVAHRVQYSSIAITLTGLARFVRVVGGISPRRIARDHATSDERKRERKRSYVRWTGEETISQQI